MGVLVFETFLASKNMGPNRVRGHVPVLEKVSYSSSLITKNGYGSNGTAEHSPQGQALGQGRQVLGQAGLLRAAAKETTELQSACWRELGSKKMRKAGKNCFFSFLPQTGSLRPSPA